MVRLNFIFSLFLIGLSSFRTLSENLNESKSYVMSVNGNPESFPIVNLGSDDRLDIGFDLLTDDREYLQYSLTHCDRFGKPSSLIESEFIDGFNIFDVENFNYSRSTLIPYVHYSIDLSDTLRKLKLSGCYRIDIFREGESDSPILSNYFYVSENSVSISSAVSSVTDIDYNRSHQQLAVEVMDLTSDKSNMTSPMELVVVQNRSPYFIRRINSPNRIFDRKSFFDHNSSLIFPAGNEYRRFETVDLISPGMNVEETTYSSGYYNVKLTADLPKEQYFFDNTRQGAFAIRKLDSDDSETEADYSLVEFNLLYPHLPDYDIYIDGDFINNNPELSKPMDFNRETGTFFKKTLLKQGHYNYRYIRISKTANRQESIDGNYHQTVNRYDTLLFVRRPGERYDRLVGNQTVYSLKQ